MTEQTDFQPRDPNYADRIAASFARQEFMNTLGAVLDSVTPGRVSISMPYDLKLVQQHGFMHASAVAAIADSACGYAALGLMDANREVVSIEYKVNFVAPALGDRFVARAEVISAGGRVIACHADVFAQNSEEGTETLCSAMQATMYSVAASQE